MSILSLYTALDDALCSLQADRVRLVAIARTLHEPLADDEAALFTAAVEQVDREMESLAYRLAYDSTPVLM